MDLSKEPFKDSPNANVALIEFSDFQCPFCGRYEKDTYPQLIKDYVDTGKVKYVWRDLPLDFHQNAEKAAEALGLNTSLFLQCLDTGRFAADIKKDIDDAGNAGISGTPSFLIGIAQPNGLVKVTKAAELSRSDTLSA